MFLTDGISKTGSNHISPRFEGIIGTLKTLAIRVDYTCRPYGLVGKIFGMFWLWIIHSKLERTIWNWKTKFCWGDKNLVGKTSSYLQIRMHSKLKTSQFADFTTFISNNIIPMSISYMNKNRTKSTSLEFFSLIILNHYHVKIVL